MGEYLRFAAAALIGLILVLVVGRQSKDLSLLLSLAVCVLPFLVADGAKIAVATLVIWSLRGRLRPLMRYKKEESL